MSDLIDRQALLKQIDIDSDGEPGYYGDTWKFIDTIKNMPNVHDLPKDADTISRQAAIDAIEHLEIPEDMCVFEILSHIELEIGTLPSAQPEQRTGKWIPQDHNKRAGNISTCVYCYPICSKCGKVGIETYKYCPNCGSYNGGENEI